MNFLFILIFEAVIFFGISLFYKLPSIVNTAFHFFLQQVISLTLFLSVFAIMITGGKTIFIVFIPLFLILLQQKFILFSLPSIEKIKNKIPYLLIILPIGVIQFLLQYDLSTLTPYLPSDDILLYGSFANGLVQFGNENKYEALSQLYPHLFSGMAPYHYYEIWFTSLIGFITGKSYAMVIQMVVYPYLIWLFILGIISAFEHFNKSLQKKHYIFSILLLFIGPVYFSTYETIFHDGDFFPSTVFTISGFVKQTLAFSYYGQKHLPVYIFALLSFLFLLKQRYNASLISGLLIALL
jgi:hypothetical protein